MRPVFVIRSILVACLVLAATAPASGAATLLVGPAGENSGDCRDMQCAGLAYAYGQSADGDVVEVAEGSYGDEVIPAGTKAVTFHGPGASVRTLYIAASNVTVDGIDVDTNFEQSDALHIIDGHDVTITNASIGNVTDAKGAYITGQRVTFDHVLFHDVIVTDPDIHNECAYALGTNGLTVRDSTFRNCATMDLFFNYCSWCDPEVAPYGGITLENNVFGHTTMDDGAWHYYSVVISALGPAADGGTLTDWVVRNNTFESTVSMARPGATGSRWVNNIGDWDCVPGMAYSHNVGNVCGATDTGVAPAASTMDISAAQGWVDPFGGDFRLAAGAAAIDAGDPDDATANDHDGTPRDAAPDAGAFEYIHPDTSPPTTEIAGGPAGLTRNSSPAFTMTASEDGSTFECRVDWFDTIGTWAPCPARKVYRGLPDGIYTFLARAIDPAGNTGAAVRRAFAIDTTAPAAPAITAPAQAGWSRSAEIVLTGTTEPGATVALSEGDSAKGQTVADDHGAWTHRITAATDGAHTYTARATDAAGNADPSNTATRMIMVDTQAPETSIVAGPPATSEATSASFELGPAEPGIAFECRLDSPASTAAAWGPCASPVRYADLKVGTYAFHVRATDQAGNVDSSEATRSFAVSAPAPPQTAPETGTTPPQTVPAHTDPPPTGAPQVDAPIAPAPDAVPAPPAGTAPGAAASAGDPSPASALGAALSSWATILRGRGLAALTTAGGLLLPFEAPVAGTLTLELVSEPGRGAPKGARALTVAAGRHRFDAPAAAAVRATLTRGGRLLLKRVRRPRLTLRVTFTPRGGPPARVSRSVDLARSR